jgi:hypothetical protein
MERRRHEESVMTVMTIKRHCIRRHRVLAGEQPSAALYAALHIRPMATALKRELLW